MALASNLPRRNETHAARAESPPEKKTLYWRLPGLSLTSICGCKVEDAGYMIYLWQLERMREFEEGVGSVKRAEVGKFMLRAGFPKIHIWREDVCISI